MNDIIKIKNQSADNTTINSKEPEIKPIKKEIEPPPVTLTEILTQQNEPKDMYKHDDEVIQETYNTIFFQNPALFEPLPPTPPQELYETIFFPTSALTVPLTPPPLPPIPNRLMLNQIDNTVLVLPSIPIEVDQLDDSVELPELLPPPIPINIDDPSSTPIMIGQVNDVLLVLPPPSILPALPVPGELATLPAPTELVALPGATKLLALPAPSSTALVALPPTPAHYHLKNLF